MVARAASLRAWASFGAPFQTVAPARLSKRQHQRIRSSLHLERGNSYSSPSRGSRHAGTWLYLGDFGDECRIDLRQVTDAEQCHTARNLGGE